MVFSGNIRGGYKIMNKNYMQEIAKMLGVEFEEKFYIRDENNIRTSGNRDSIYHFDEDGFFDENNEQRLYMLYCLLTGDCTIEKMPWKPKNNDIYWYINIDGDLYRTMFLCDNEYDLMFYKSGNCFKSKEDAERNRKRILKELDGIRKELE